MSVLEKAALGVGALFILLGVLRLTKSPLKTVFRVAGNAALGFGALWLLGRTVPGLHLGLNVFNSLVIGVLGLPGFGLLLLLQWVLTWGILRGGQNCPPPYTATLSRVLLHLATSYVIIPMALHERQAVGHTTRKGVRQCVLPYISDPIRSRLS